MVGSGIVVGALLTGGSAGDDGADGVRTVQPGAPGDPGRELTEEDVAALGSPGHTPADTGFMQDMIAHHAQALEMTALVETRTESADLPLLAERITVSQEAEIALMEYWLTDRGEEVPDTATHQAHGLMPGMATTRSVPDALLPVAVRGHCEN